MTGKRSAGSIRKRASRRRQAVYWHEGRFRLRGLVRNQDGRSRPPFDDRNRFEARRVGRPPSWENLFQEVRRSMARSPSRSGDPYQRALWVSPQHSHLPSHRKLLSPEPDAFKSPRTARRVGATTRKYRCEVRSTAPGHGVLKTLSSFRELANFVRAEVSEFLT